MAAEGIYHDLVSRNTELPYYRTAPRQLLAENTIPSEDGNYIIYAGDFANENNISLLGYTSKFELRSRNIAVIIRSENSGETRYLYRTPSEAHRSENPFGIIAEHIDSCDALLVYKQDPEFEVLLNEFLSTYNGNTPVLYAY